jgi:hypothetical protein
MPLNPANATELATIAREVGAEVVEGDLLYPSETGSWQLGDVDLSEHLDRDQLLTATFESVVYDEPSFYIKAVLLFQ